jgi:hypothetical protein
MLRSDFLSKIAAYRRKPLSADVIASINVLFVRSSDFRSTFVQRFVVVPYAVCWCLCVRPASCASKRSQGWQGQEVITRRSCLVSLVSVFCDQSMNHKGFCFCESM